MQLYATIPNLNRTPKQPQPKEDQTWKPLKMRKRVLSLTSERWICGGFAFYLALKREKEKMVTGFK